MNTKPTPSDSSRPGEFSLPADSLSLVGKLAKMYPPATNPNPAEICSEEARLKYMETVGARKVIDFLLEQFPQRGPK